MTPEERIVLGTTPPESPLDLPRFTADTPVSAYAAFGLEKPISVDEKIRSIQLAAEEKAAALAAKNKPWAEDSEIGTVWGTIKGVAAGLTTGGARIGANIADSFRMAEDRALRNHLEPESEIMFQQYESAKTNLNTLNSQLGKVDPITRERLLLSVQEEQSKLNQAESWLNQPVKGIARPSDQFDPTYTPPTRLRAIENYKKFQEGNAPVAAALGSEIANQFKQSVEGITNQKQFASVNPVMEEGSKKAAQAWEEGNLVTGSLGFAKEQLSSVVEAFATDPAASLVKMSESLLDTLASTNPLRAALVYGPRIAELTEKSYKDFQKAHDGRLPNEKEKAIIDLMGSLAVGSDLIGNVLQVKMVPGLEKLLKGKPDVVPDALKADVIAKFPKLKETLTQAGKLAAIPVTETAQGTFQELADQYAGKQVTGEDGEHLIGDTFKNLNYKEIARGGIEEGFAASIMGGPRVVTAPKEILAAGAKNNALKQATEVTEAFKQTDAYSALPKISQAPVEAYRAFEKVSADAASTPEQKQAAFDNAVVALVNTPQFNTAAIAGKLKEQSTGLTIAEPIAQVLGQLATKPETLVTKTVAKAKEFGKAVENNMAQKFDLTDEQIDADPVNALRKYTLIPFKASTLEDWGPEKDAILKKATEIKNKAKAKGVSEDVYLSDINVLVGRALDFEQTLETNQNLVKKVSEIKPDQEILGSNLEAIKAAMARVPNLNLNELETLEQAPAINPEQKAVIQGFKNIAALKKTINEVSENVIQLSDGKKVSMKDYTNQFQAALLLKDEKAAKAILANLEKFSVDYVAKNQRVQDAWKDVSEAYAAGTDKKKIINVPQINPKADLLEIKFETGDGKKSSKVLVTTIASDNQVIQAHIQKFKLDYKTAFNPQGVASGTKTQETITPEQGQAEAEVTPTTTSTPTTTEVGAGGTAVEQGQTVTDEEPPVRDEAPPEFDEDQAAEAFKSSVEATEQVVDTEVAPTPVEPVVEAPKVITKESLKARIEELIKIVPEGKGFVINSLKAHLAALDDPKTDLNKVNNQLAGISANINNTIQAKTTSAKAEPKAIIKNSALNTFIDPVGNFIRNLTIALNAGSRAVYNKLIDATRLNKQSVFLKTPNILEILPKETHQAISDIAAKIEAATHPSSVHIRPSQDPTVILRQGIGNLDPAVIQATAVAGYSYMGIRGGSLAFNNLDTIGLIINDPDNAHNHPEAVSILKHIGVNSNNLAEDLGSIAYDLLGIEIDAGSDNDTAILKKRIKLALGFIAIKGLIDTNYLDQSKMDLNDYNSLIVQRSTSGQRTVAERSKESITFNSVKFQRDAENNILLDDVGNTLKSKEVNTVIDLFKDNPEIKKAFADLTAAERQIKPRLKPSDKAPKHVTNSFQNLNPTATKVVEQINSLPYEFHVPAMNLFLAMYNDPTTKLDLLVSLGYTPEDKLKLTHVNERKILETMNEDLINSLNDIIEYHSMLADPTTPVFFTHEIWKSNRIGITNDSGINPLQDKITRHLVSPTAFNIKITKDVLDDPKQVYDIEASIAAGFDIESGKLTAAQVKAKLDILENRDEVKTALADMSNQNVVAVLRMKNMVKTHTLEALLALKALRDAQKELKETGSVTERTIRLSQEVDGKTNGVAIALAQTFGIENQVDLVNALDAVGLFTNPQRTQYHEEGVNSVKDLYNQIVDLWKAGFEQLYISDPQHKDLYDAQRDYLGEITRDMAKYPLMTATFGKSLENIAIDFGKVMLEKVYEQASKIAQEAAADPKYDLDKAIASLNLHVVNLAQGLNESDTDNFKKTRFPNKFTKENYLSHKLSLELEAAIKANAVTTYGNALQDAINNKFTKFFEYRDSMNGAVSTISKLFINLVDDKVGEQVLTDDWLRVLTSTSVTEGGLREFIPSFRSVHSTNENNGLVPLKETPVRAINEQSKVQVSFSSNTETKNIFVKTSRFKDTVDLSKPTTSITGNIKEIKLQDPRLGSTILGIHGIDAAMMYNLILKYAGFGAHDAYYFNPANVELGSQQFNEIFSNVNQSYLIAEAINDRLQEIQTLVNAEVRAGRLDTNSTAYTTFMTDMKKVREGSTTTFPNGTTKTIQPFPQVLQEIQTNNKEWWSKIKVVTQYVTNQSGFTNPNFKGEAIPEEMPTEATFTVDELTTLVDQVFKSAVDTAIENYKTETGVKNPKQSTKDKIINDLNTQLSEYLAKTKTINLSELTEALKCRANKK